MAVSALIAVVSVAAVIWLAVLVVVALWVMSVGADQ